MTLRVARTGVRGANDLVWVGWAANYAAKLTSLSADYPSRITGEVYDSLHESLKFIDGKSMWQEVTWTDMNKKRIYRSTWHWSID
jgi:class 3 adenylate cyclase